MSRQNPKETPIIFQVTQAADASAQGTSYSNIDIFLPYFLVKEKKSYFCQ